MITPIIMESDIKVVKAKLDLLRARQVNRVHVDIGDGMFCDLLTISPADLQQVDYQLFKMDMHLLVDDPVEWIEECVALNPQRLIAQIEHMGSQSLFLNTVKEYGVEAGLALKIETEIEAIEPEALKNAKAIILLEIPPGTSGSPFDMRVIKKIKKLRNIYKGSIIVDGGVNPETYKLAIEAGADEGGANNAWWKGEFNNES